MSSAPNHFLCPVAIVREQQHLGQRSLNPPKYCMNPSSADHLDELDPFTVPFPSGVSGGKDSFSTALHDKDFINPIAGVLDVAFPKRKIVQCTGNPQQHAKPS